MRVILLRMLAITFVITQVARPDVRAQQAPDVSGLALPGGPAQTDARPQIFGIARDIQIVVKLADPSLAQAHGKNAKQTGGNLNAGQQRQYAAQLEQKQDALMAQIRNLGGRELGRLTKAHNGVIVAINPSQVPAVAALPGVVTVRQLHDYKLDLSETVPYIGAKAVQDAGVTGAGVRVA